MNLAARGAARQREKIVMRLGSVLVTLAVLASLVLEPPRAKAFAVTSSAVTALAGAYLNACGLVPVVSGMSSSQEVNESLARLIQDYLDTELPGTPLTDWLGNLGNLSLVHDAEWMLLLPTQAAASLHLFATWVASKYGTQAGTNQVFGVTGDSVLLADGTKFYLCTNYDARERKFLNPGTPITKADFPVTFATGAYIKSGLSDGREAIFLYNSSGEFVDGRFVEFDISSQWPIYIGIHASILYLMYPTLSTYVIITSFDVSKFDFGAVTSVDESLSLDVAETLTIPGELPEYDVSIRLSEEPLLPEPAA